MSYLIPIIIILLLIVANGLFVAAEFAIVAARKPRVAQLGRDGNHLAQQVSAILEDATLQDRYIATAQLGITLASVGLGMYGERSIAGWLYGPLEHYGHLGEALAHTLGTIISVSLLTYLHVVLGEMIPKALALQAPESTALRVSRAMQLFGRALRPFIWVLDGISTAFLRLLGIPIAGHGQFYSASELEQLVDESFEEGEVADKQHELIDNIFSFGDRDVAQLMTPRPKVTGLPVTAQAEDVVKAMDKGYSRFPVYEQDLDHITGILHVRDFIRMQARGESFSLKRLMRRAPRVPEHLPAETLLDAFKRLKVHMAVVMNEYGGTAGIVTLEDLLEEVVGELQDEHGNGLPDIEKLGDNAYSVRGNVLIDDINRHFGLKLPDNTSDTISGLVIAALRRAAQEGDEIKLGDLNIKVESVSGLTIERLHLSLDSLNEPNKYAT